MKKEDARQLRNRERENTFDRADRELRAIFRSANTSEARWRALKEKIGVALTLPIPGVDTESMIGAVHAASAEENEEDFVSGIIHAIRPLLDFRARDPKQFEKIQRMRTAETGGHSMLNEVFSYTREGSQLHIHVGQSIFEEGKLMLFRDALQKLAMIVRQDESIREVCATSWIVAAHPNVLKRFGFTMLGVIDEEARAAHFSSEDADTPIARAVITRETLIERYGANTHPE